MDATQQERAIEMVNQLKQAGTNCGLLAIQGIVVASKFSRRAFIGISAAAIIAAAGDKASEHFLEFFAATIRNKNTRAAYVPAVAQF